MCDSTNLNLSPLCDLLATNTWSEATLWGEAAAATYHGRGLELSYVENILGHTRQFYINQDRRDRELLSSIVKVPSISISWFYLDILFRPELTAIMLSRGTFPFSTFTSETPQ